MATTAVGDGLPTLLDIAKMLDPDGMQANVIDAMTKKSPFLQSAVWMEGNLPTGHLITTQSALPSLAWRKKNEGVPRSKGRTDQVTETCGQLAGASELDVDLVRLNGGAAYRQRKDKAFISAYHNQLEQAVFYSDTASTPEQIQGLAPRLNSLSGAYGGQAVSSQISSSGSDQTSIWFVVWGTETVSCIYPKGMPMGLQIDDLGKQRIADENGNYFTGYVTDFKWDIGIAVHDARYLVRLCNIDTSAIVKTGKLLIEDMIDAWWGVNDWNGGRGAIYANRTICKYLDQQATSTISSAGPLTVQNVNGTPVTHFRGIPIHMTDGILDTEAVVS